MEPDSTGGLLAEERHRRLAAYVRDLNALYRAKKPMHEVDGKHIGFDWIDPDNAQDSVIAFPRMGKDPRQALLFVLTSPPSPARLPIGVPYPMAYRPIFPSNDAAHGGASRPAGGNVEADEVARHGRSFSPRLDPAGAQRRGAAPG